MTQNEALSRLLSGELPAEEAAAWRARIASEPLVARAWADLQQLTADLGALPEAPLPDALIAQVAEASEPAPTVPRAWGPWWGALAAALLGMVAGLAVPEPVPTLELVAGEQRVVGEARVVAGGLPVRIEGDVTVSVEPVGPVVRGFGQEVDMNPTNVVAFGAGALVTVAVTQGMAWIEGPGEPQLIEVPAGTERTLRGAAQPPPSRGVPTPAVDPTAPPAEQIASLEAAIEQLTFERDALRGQLAVAGGEALAWPESLRPELRPDRFSATLSAMLEGSEYQVADVDCSEYPCLAVFDLGTAENPMAAAQEMAAQLRAGAESVLGDDDIGMGVQIEAVESDDGPANMLMGVSLGSGDADPRDARVNGRLTDLLEQWRPDEEGAQ